MDRRNFIKGLATGAAGLAATGTLAANRTGFRFAEDISADRIPRWRGFNLQGRFPRPGQTLQGSAFDEFDFATMAEWRFDFARLPLSYWVWGSKDDWSGSPAMNLRVSICRPGP